MVKPRIYVIIVTWNGMKWMKECMDSIRKSTVAVATVVIDNGSTDETCAFIRDNYPEVILFEAGKNLGFGKANNVGMRYALDQGADYVYLLNQDAYVYPEMFAELLKVSENPEYENVGIFSPLHVYGNRKAFDLAYKGYLKAITIDMVEDLIFKSLRESYFVDCVPAAGWLIPKHTLLTIGGFDPIFFHYGEDHHYAQRVKYHGFRTAVVPRAMMVHDREVCGNEYMARKDMVFRDLKTEIFLNINNSFGRRLYMFFNKYFFFVLYAPKLITNGKGRIVWEQFTAIGKSIICIPKYLKNRRANKTKGQLWLEEREIVEMSQQIR